MRELVGLRSVKVHLDAKWCNGSHDRLKICCLKEREGSSPSLATIYPMFLICRDSTTVVQGNHNPSVGGSSPSSDTNFQLKYGEVG